MLDPLATAKRFCPVLHFQVECRIYHFSFTSSQLPFSHFPFGGPNQQFQASQSQKVRKGGLPAGFSDLRFTIHDSRFTINEKGHP